MGAALGGHLKAAEDRRPALKGLVTPYQREKAPPPKVLRIVAPL